jgi:hypothetical protein
MRFFFLLLFCVFSLLGYAENAIELTLIPPTSVTNKVNLDVRAGVHNPDLKAKKVEITFYLNRVASQTVLFHSTIAVSPHFSQCVRFVMPTADKVGKNKIIVVAKDGRTTQKAEKPIEIIPSPIRSAQTIDGAWTGIYHWSETEGKMWNPDIKRMTDSQWKELVRSMHAINMNIIIIQETFRNEQYVDKHAIEKEGYQGKAFYPSQLYAGRMPIAAHDPVEAILSQADSLGMNVFVGVGMYAWFDFTAASLNWHKKVAKELWQKYGHHTSFYGWYISEENSGGLEAYSKDDATKQRRQSDIVSFFKGFKSYCSQLAPDKPVMLATSSYDVPKGEAVYPELLKYLDILCPFGFARMPEGDLTGEEAAKRLQQLCDRSQTHLWFDLEAFLFHKEGYLYPRPIEEIVHDLTLFDNFEKTVCYQYPGVFNSPAMSIRVGEASTVKLYTDYQKYLQNKQVK